LGLAIFELTMKIEQITFQLTWHIRQEVLWPDEPLNYVQLEQDPEGQHYGVFEGDRLISVISLFVDGKTAQFRKFATRKDLQGKGFGSALLQYVLDDIPTHDINRVWCNARADRTSYYHKFGLEETDSRFEKNGERYVIMEKSV
jgi:GNAT superfamily N-acetyltransferase